MHKLGKKQITLQLATPLTAVPAALARHQLVLSAHGLSLTHTYDTRRGDGTDGGIATLMADLAAAGVTYTDLQTRQSSLEDIFVSLVHQP
jgi:ABC-2 type transport system ATP-binding protein